MKRYALGVVLLMMCGTGDAQKGQVLPPEEVIALATAPNEKLTAVVTDAPPALWLLGSGNPTKVPLPVEVSQPRLSWSADSKYVAVEYQINDDASAVDIVDIGQTPPVVIDAGRGHSAKWSRSGHQLFIVPDFGVDELPKTPGLIVFDPALRKSDTVAREYYFIGRYDVGGAKIVAQAIQYVDGRPTYSLIAHDLKNGAVDVIHRPLDSQRSSTREHSVAAQSDPASWNRVASSPTGPAAGRASLRGALKDGVVAVRAALTRREFLGGRPEEPEEFRGGR